MITSYFKSELDGDLHNSLLETMKAYNNYKKWFKFPSAIKGKIDLNLSSQNAICHRLSVEKQA